MSVVLGVLPLAGIPAAAMVIGCLIALFYTPGAHPLAASQHLAAGLMMSAVAVELVPVLNAVQGWVGVVAIAAGFSIGVATMQLVSHLTLSHHNYDYDSEDDEGKALMGHKALMGRRRVQSVLDRNRMPWAIMAAVAVDCFCAGFLIGLAMMEGTRAGVIITFVLGMQMFFLGIACSSSIVKRGLGLKAASVCFVLPLFVLLGGVVGAALMASVFGAVKTAVVSFGVACLMYLAMEELVSEAHEEQEDSIPITLSFFLGFLVPILLDKVVQPFLY